MPDTSKEIFNDMRMDIVETLTEDWGKYIETVTAAYDTAFNNVKDLLAEIQAEIIEQQKAQQALMVGVLTVLTGGVVGVFAEKLATKLVPEAESMLQTEITATADSLFIKTTRVAKEDPILYKIFRDTAKDAVKKGGDKLTELGLDQFKGEPRSAPFKPDGLSVAEYRQQLVDGITDRAKFLTFFAKLLLSAADSIPPDLADSLRTGMLKNDFFDDANRKHVRNIETLVNKAELALWCAWGLGRDQDYWEKQNALKLYGFSEIYNWDKLRERLVKKLGVPEEPITISMDYGAAFGKTKKGMDFIGFMNWAKSADMVHTLYEGIHTAGGYPHSWATQKMQELGHMASTAA
jgi:hypothetical protein